MHPKVAYHSCPVRRSVFKRLCPFRTGLLFSLGLLLSGSQTFATGVTLAATSPFLAEPNGETATTTSAVAPIELRGIMTAPQGTLFAIYESGKKFSSTWVGLNEVGFGFVVRSHRIVAGEDQVTVDYQGRTMVLTLKTAKIAASAENRVSREPPRPESLAKQAMPGIPTTELLPQEMAKLQMLTAQVRNRMNRQKETAAAQNPGSQPPAGR